MEINFEKVYAVPLTAMRLNRSHPEVPRDKKWIFQFFLLQGAFTVVFLVMAYNIVLSVGLGKYPDACRNGTVSVIYAVVSFQYFILLLKQENLKKIIEMMKEDFKKSLPCDEKKIVLEFTEKGTIVCRQWAVVAFITGAVFPLKHVALEIYLYVIGEPELLMLHPLIFPSPIEEVKMQPIVYTVMYIFVVYYVTYAVCMYICFVPLGPSFMLHACGQLEIVKKRAEELFKNKGEEEVRVKLVEIVKQLQYIYEFVDCVKDSFRVVYEMTLKGSAILLPITLYQVITAFKNSEFSVEFIMFIFSGTLISSLPCYYGDMLMEKGEDVRLAIYCCGWEVLYDRSIRTTILFILQRALQPVSIRTLFRTVCLDALTDLFQQSYALFNLMNAAWE